MSRVGVPLLDIRRELLASARLGGSPRNSGAPRKDFPRREVFREGGYSTGQKKTRTVTGADAESPWYCPVCRMQLGPNAPWSHPCPCDFAWESGFRNRFRREFRRCRGSPIFRDRQLAARPPKTRWLHVVGYVCSRVSRVHVDFFDATLAPSSEALCSVRSVHAPFLVWPGAPGPSVHAPFVAKTVQNLPVSLFPSLDQVPLPPTRSSSASTAWTDLLEDLLECQEPSAAPRGQAASEDGQLLRSVRRLGSEPSFGHSRSCWPRQTTATHWSSLVVLFWSFLVA